MTSSDYENINDVIKKMMRDELIKANKKFPSFQTRHEAYAVILEEVEESTEEIEFLKSNLKDYWRDIRLNKDKATVNKALFYLHSSILNSIIELIQVGAMVQKAWILEKDNE